MGLIKSIFGGLFAFLGSLFGVVGKLLGLGKSKEEYFLDLGGADTGAPAAPAAAPAPTAVAAPPAPAAVAAPAPAPVAAAPKPQATGTFAPNYLIAPSSNNSRRRPGPSLAGFKDMARQVKPMA